VRFEPAGDRALTVDAVRVRVALWPLLRRTVDADIAWEAYGGRARGTWVSRPAPGGARFALDQVGQGFELARLPFLPPGDWRGTLRLDVTCRWTNEAWWTGEGAGSAEVTGLRIDGLTVAGVPLDGIEFDTIAAQVALKGGTVTVQRFAAGGALGTASGEVRFWCGCRGTRHPQPHAQAVPSRQGRRACRCWPSRRPRAVRSRCTSGSAREA
jgi:type II secretion system protein N